MDNDGGWLVDYRVIYRQLITSEAIYRRRGEEEEDKAAAAPGNCTDAHTFHVSTESILYRRHGTHHMGSRLGQDRTCAPMPITYRQCQKARGGGGSWSTALLPPSKPIFIVRTLVGKC